jgi:hypothetical protein
LKTAVTSNYNGTVTVKMSKRLKLARFYYLYVEGSEDRRRSNKRRRDSRDMNK